VSVWHGETEGDVPRKNEGGSAVGQVDECVRHGVGIHSDTERKGIDGEEWKKGGGKGPNGVARKEEVEGRGEDAMETAKERGACVTRRRKEPKYDGVARGSIRRSFV
jgi:hypothetical protein